MGCYVTRLARWEIQPGVVRLELLITPNKWVCNVRQRTQIGFKGTVLGLNTIGHCIGTFSVPIAGALLSKLAL